MLARERLEICQEGWFGCGKGKEELIWRGLMFAGEGFLNPQKGNK